MASAVVSDNFETGSGGVPQLGGTGATTCKAWVNFDGTGTISIRDSYNVSSINDQGTGQYRVNFMTAMPNANYSVSGIAAGMNGITAQNNFAIHHAEVYSVNYVQVYSLRGAVDAAMDTDRANVQVFSN